VKKRVRKLKGGGMDASQADFSSPSSTGTAGGRPNPHTDTGFSKATKPSGGKTGGGGNTGKDVPFKAPLPTAGLITGLINLGAYANYKGRQKFAKKQGLYRDHYKVTGKTLQPNSPSGKSYLKDAGYGKTKPIASDRDKGKIIPPITPMAAKPATAVQQPFKPYYMGFDFQKPFDETIQRRLPPVNFKRGGLSGGKRFGPPPKKGPNPHGICPHRKDGIRGVGAVEKGRGVKFVGVK